MACDPFGSPILDLEEDGDRLLALLAAAYGRPASPDILRHVEGAASYWRRGEKALANIRLAFAQLPRLEDRADAWRLFLAEELLDDGMAPTALMRGLGFEPPYRDFVKYDPNQPRIPAGNGRSGGRWGSGVGEPQDSVSARVVPPPAPQAARGANVLRAARGVGTLAQGLFEAVASNAFLAGLARLAAAAGRPGLTLGLILIPTPAGRVSQGGIPGAPDLHYTFDEPAGVLRVYREGENGRQTVAYATRGAHDIFVDHETGSPIARLLNGNLVLDADSLAAATTDPHARVETKGETDARSKPDKPKLCPDPSADVEHGASDRAWIYQYQISKLNNPHRPLQPGLAVSLPNPANNNKAVVFDDCRESDGTMIEAKGERFAYLLQRGPPIADNVIKNG